MFNPIESIFLYYSMKAAVYSVKRDPPELDIVELPYPEPGVGEVTVRLEYVGVNPIDYWISGGRYPIESENRVVGSEGYGIVDSVGDNVSNISVGDRVSIYPWIHCGSCRYCLQGLENLCVRGGIIGGVLDGCYAEYVRVPVKNVSKVERGRGEYLAVAGVSALTAYHAVNLADISEGENVLVFGASGNVGMFLLQYSKLRGANVYGVSRWGWILDYGADYRLSLDELDRFITENNIEFDVIFNSIGGSLFGESMKYLSRRGRLVTFGGLISMSSEIDIATLYRRELRIIGSTGGTYKEFEKVVMDLAEEKVYPKIWRIFPLEKATYALRSLFDPNRSGKILIKI